MNPFGYSRASDAQQAVNGIAATPQAKFLGGGTNLIDLMKMGVETPAQLIDITRLPLAQVEELPGGKGVRIGALGRNSDVAYPVAITTCFVCARDVGGLALIAVILEPLRCSVTVALIVAAWPGSIARVCVSLKLATT